MKSLASIPYMRGLRYVHLYVWIPAHTYVYPYVLLRAVLFEFENHDTQYAAATTTTSQYTTRNSIHLNGIMIGWYYVGVVALTL